MSFDAVVASFDGARGDGLLRDGLGREFYFHCVNIADGTRDIEVGASVSARRSVGLRGHDEAADVVKR